MKANGGVNILDVRARAILVGNGCGIGHLSRRSIVIYHGGNGVWLTVGESDGQGNSFVTLILGVGRVLNSLGDFNNDG